MHTLVELAEQLRALHVPGAPLVLPNIWDANGARRVVSAGFPAVATGSVAVAESLGFPDGEAAPVEEMFAAAGRVAAAVEVPVTMDAEAGYGLAPEDLVQRLVAIGVAGCNLEDTDHRSGRLVDAAEQAARLAAVRVAADAAGVPLVINARIDVFLDLPAEDHSDRLPDALERARRYLDAGADCVYPILVAAPAREQFLDRLAGSPVNLLVPADPAGVRAATRLGAARVSMGPALWRAQRRALDSTLLDLATATPSSG